VAESEAKNLGTMGNLDLKEGGFFKKKGGGGMENFGIGSCPMGTKKKKRTASLSKRVVRKRHGGKVEKGKKKF